MTLLQVVLVVTTWTVIYASDEASGVEGLYRRGLGQGSGEVTL